MLFLSIFSSIYLFCISGHFLTSTHVFLYVEYPSCVFLLKYVLNARFLSLTCTQNCSFILVSDFFQVRSLEYFLSSLWLASFSRLGSDQSYVKQKLISLFPWFFLISLLFLPISCWVRMSFLPKLALKSPSIYVLPLTLFGSLFWFFHIYLYHILQLWLFFYIVLHFYG